MKWVVGKKSALGDKAAVRRHATAMGWERVPYAMQPIHTCEDMEGQHRQVRTPIVSFHSLASSMSDSIPFYSAQLLSLWELEGVSPEPMEDVE